MSSLFPTITDREKAVMDLTNLQQSEGWKTLVKILEANLVELTEHLLGFSGPEPNDIIEINRIRNKIQLHREMLEFPKKLVGLLSTGDPVEIRSDPYSTLEDIEKEKAEKFDSEE